MYRRLFEVLSACPYAWHGTVTFLLCTVLIVYRLLFEALSACPFPCMHGTVMFLLHEDVLFESLYACSFPCMHDTVTFLLCEDDCMCLDVWNSYIPLWTWLKRCLHILVLVCMAHLHSTVYSSDNLHVHMLACMAQLHSSSLKMTEALFAYSCACMYGTVTFYCVQ